MLRAGGLGLEVSGTLLRAGGKTITTPA